MVHALRNDTNQSGGQGVRKGLTPGFIESVPETIHRESVKYQIKVMKDE